MLRYLNFGGRGGDGDKILLYSKRIFLGLLGHSGNLHVLLPYIRKSNLLIPDDIHDAVEAREFTLNTN